uniref:Uncharacterized protein n=1 Tax=Saccharum hybrid cultivar R570 TaxID=131158 RepID=A0A059Q1H8_9POAL|nr:hypothetical protein SHCRBa_019_G01_R_20 [Saccharum hybrid cultivar R570]
MFNPEINTENVITISEEDLKEEQKQAMEKAMEDYRQLCLKSFSLNRSGEVIQKQDLPLPRQVTFDTNPEGQVPPLYVGPAYHQPEPASVNAPSAPSAVAGTEVTSPLVSAGLPNVQSTPIRSGPVLSGG